MDLGLEVITKFKYEHFISKRYSLRSEFILFVEVKHIKDEEKPKFYLKTQSVPRCKHIQSRLRKPTSECSKGI